MLATAGTVAAGEPSADAPAVEHSSLDAVPPLRWSAAGEPTDGGYRVSLTRGALDFGLEFAQRGAGVRPLDAGSERTVPAGVMLPALSFGLRSVSAGPAPAHSLVQRALASATAASYVSKVGIEWKPAKSQVFLNQGLGFRLGGDDKITMRLRKGSLGIYLKRNF
ncbi:MAG: hypothetical protein ABIQ06_15020 [Caldimonas sp.]